MTTQTKLVRDFPSLGGIRWRTIVNKSRLREVLSISKSRHASRWIYICDCSKVNKSVIGRMLLTFKQLHRWVEGLFISKRIVWKFSVSPVAWMNAFYICVIMLTWNWHRMRWGLQLHPILWDCPKQCLVCVYVGRWQLELCLFRNGQLPRALKLDHSVPNDFSAPCPPVHQGTVHERTSDCNRATAPCRPRSCASLISENGSIEWVLGCSAK